MKTAKRIFCGFLVLLLSEATHIAEAQGNYESLHGITGYDYKIKGELELTFTNSIKYINGNKQEGSYRIKSPVLLSYNLNDLKFFKNEPGEFTGYVENRVTASCGKPCGGGLIDTSQGFSNEEENWMQADVQFKSLEDGTLSEVNARGEIYPLLDVFFSIPDFKVGENPLQFRLFIKGISDPRIHPVRNVIPQSNASTSPDNTNFNSSINESDKAYKELLKVDKAAAEEFKKGFQSIAGSSVKAASLLPISVTCGTFFGPDMENALMKRNLQEADAAAKKEFEIQFEKEYFKDIPRIDAMRLINYLIKPTGDYESPITGSFSSVSESGSENATYQGTLRLFGEKVQKSE